MKVWQCDVAGFLLFEATADPSPREPGKHLVPARCVTTPPPDDIPEGKAARWNGAAWQIVKAPAADPVRSPTEKLQRFLDQNPDVASLLNT